MNFYEIHRCSISDATHALVGRGPEGAVGVIHWHSQLKSAQKDALAINKRGGRVRVVDAPGGKLRPHVADEVREMVLKSLNAVAHA